MSPPSIPRAPGVRADSNGFDVNGRPAVLKFNTQIVWKYEMRREMQEVVPGVFLGPYFVASSSADALLQAGVTHVVCIRDPREAHIVRPYHPDRFCYLELEVEDANEQHLITLMPQVSAFTWAALQQGGKVFIHCNSGIYRSPAFVMAFLMEHYNLPYVEAFQKTQQQRFCINPSASYRNALREYEPILMAKKYASPPAAIVVTGQVDSGTSGSKQSRKRDDADDDGRA